jgi:hypothetical protein
MGMASSAATKSLTDQRVSRVLTPDRTPHEARDVEMSIMDSIDFNASRDSTLVGYDFIVEILQFEILHADRSFELGLHVDGFNYSLLMIADAEDPPGQSLLRGTDNAPASVLPIQMGIDVCPVSPSLKGLSAFVITGEGRHVG